MEIVVHAKLLNVFAVAAEQTRPELFGAHTKRYKSRIPFPWNANKTLNSLVLKNLSAEVDYDARGSSVSFRLAQKVLTLGLILDGAILRTSQAGELEAKFSEKVELGAIFSDAVAGKYPLLVSEAVFTNLNPAGIRILLSWIISNAISGALDLGIPERIEITSAAVLKLKKPSVANNEIRIAADLQVK